MRDLALDRAADAKLAHPRLKSGALHAKDRRRAFRAGDAPLGLTQSAENVLALDRIACRGLKPTVTILVDIDAETSLARAHARNAAEPHCETRMDEQSIEFHQRVYEAYHALAEREPERVKVVDGRASFDEIECAVWEVVGAHVR